jgi:hypothetical protein
MTKKTPPFGYVPIKTLTPKELLKMYPPKKKNKLGKIKMVKI